MDKPCYWINANNECDLKNCSLNYIRMTWEKCRHGKQKMERIQKREKTKLNKARTIKAAILNKIYIVIEEGPFQRETLMKKIQDLDLDKTIKKLL